MFKIVDFKDQHVWFSQTAQDRQGEEYYIACVDGCEVVFTHAFYDFNQPPLGVSDYVYLGVGDYVRVQNGPLTEN